MPAGHRLWTLNTPRVPQAWTMPRCAQYLLEKRGIEIAGGFGPLAGKVFRIGPMGYGSTAENVQFILEALAAGLSTPETLGPALSWNSC